MDVEDFAAGWVRLEDGATIEIETSWMSHIGRDTYTSIRLLGTKGGAELWPLRVFRDIGGKAVSITPQIEPTGWPESIHLSVEHFAESVAAGKPVISDGASCLEVLRTLDAMYRSAETGAEISL
jgi:predicted dehydrogenase